MKKKIIIFMLLMALGLTFTGCSAANFTENAEIKYDDKTKKSVSYQVYVYDCSDSVTSVNHNIEYVFADYEKYNDISAKDMITCSINGKTYTGKYKASQYREYNYFPVYQYDVDNGITFEIDDTGLLISCFWGSDTSQGTKKTKEECIEIARDFLADIVDVDDYCISVNENTNRGLYTVKFTKTVCDFKTTDSAEVVVKDDGSLYSYSSFMLGRVNEKFFSDYSVNLDDLQEKISEKISLICQEAKEKYSEIDYIKPNVDTVMLTALKNGKAGAVCSVDIGFIEDIGEYKTSVSDKVSFVIIFD